MYYIERKLCIITFLKFTFIEEIVLIIAFSNFIIYVKKSH